MKMSWPKIIAMVLGCLILMWVLITIHGCSEPRQHFPFDPPEVMYASNTTDVPYVPVQVVETNP